MLKAWLRLARPLALLCAVFAFVVAMMAVRAQTQSTALTVGILPFDAATVDGWSNSSAQAMAKLVRMEMIKGENLQPVLLDIPAGQRLPLSPQRAAEAGRLADVDVVLAGTVLEASSTQASNSGWLPSKIGTSVGGSVTRAKGTVSLEVELVDASTGKLADTFKVEAHNTDVGVGSNVSSVLGGFSMGDSAWMKTPLGKALQDAAAKLTQEVVRRRSKLTHHSS
jgi:hypothetical protein